MSDPSDELLLNIFGKELFTRWKELKAVKEFTTNEQYFKWLNEVAEHYRLDYFFDDIVLMPYPVHTEEDSHHSKIIEDLCGAELYKEWKELRHEMKFATEVQYVEWLMDVGNHYILVTPRGRSCSDEEEEAWLSKVNTVENEIDNNWETVEDREKASTVCKEQSPKVTNELAPVVKEETTLLSKRNYMSCKVCGDKAARVKYGALTCAGCEMFFYRNRRFNLNTFTCVNQEKCVVNVEQKKACAYCRLKKCLSVGMRPGGAKIKVKKLKIKGRKSKVNSKGANKEAKIKVKKVKIKGEQSEMISKGICKVCGGEVQRGTNYGVMSCEGCAIIYRKYRRISSSIRCKSNGKCAINKSSGMKCAYCHFQKCLAAGMPELGKSQQLKLTSCVVCGAQAVKISFNTMTCQRCPNFFRGSVKLEKRQLLNYECEKNSKCVIRYINRKPCKYCYYQKCRASFSTTKKVLVKRSEKVMRPSVAAASPVVVTGENFSCKHCSYVGDIKRHLKQHLISEHAYKSKYRCKACGKYFVRRKSMKKHINICQV